MSVTHVLEHGWAKHLNDGLETGICLFFSIRNESRAFDLHFSFAVSRVSDYIKPVMNLMVHNSASEAHAPHN